MRKWLILLMILAIPAMAMEVKVLSVRNDTFGSSEGYWVDLQYTLPDNSTVVNPYPVLAANIAGKNTTQAGYFIKENVRYQCNEYLKAAHPEIGIKRREAITTYLNNQVNKTFTFPDEIFFDVDVNYDGRDDNVVFDLTGNITKVIIREKENNSNLTTGIIK